MSDPSGPRPDESALIEEVAGAWRPRHPRAVQPLPAFLDLSEDGREAAFEVALRARRMEAALDDRGRSSTVRAVLDRIRAAGR